MCARAVAPRACRQRRGFAVCACRTARVGGAAVALLHALAVDAVGAAAARVIGRLLLIVVKATATRGRAVVVPVAGRNVVGRVVFLAQPPRVCFAVVVVFELDEPARYSTPFA